MLLYAIAAPLGGTRSCSVLVVMYHVLPSPSAQRSQYPASPSPSYTDTRIWTPAARSTRRRSLTYHIRPKGAEEAQLCESGRDDAAVYRFRLSVSDATITRVHSTSWEQQSKGILLSS